MTKIIYLVTHPIQYQAPLIKLFNRVLKSKLEVIYLSDFSINSFFDQGFSKNVKWDINLLDKHKYTFISKNQKKEYSYFSPFIKINLLKKIIKEKPDYLMIHGWANINFLVIMIFARFIGTKILIRSENFVKNEILIKKLIKFIYYKFILIFPHIYLYIGNANKNFYLKYGWKKKFIRFTYTVDNKYLKIQSKKDYKDDIYLNNNKVNFYFIGKLITRKNPILILQAINIIKEKFNNAHLYFIGNGNEKENLEKYIKEQKLKNISFLGFKNTSEIPKIISKFDVMICPSLEENWGLVVNESLALGKKVIVSSSVKSSEDLINKYNGLIFENNDVNDLCKCILFFINNKKTMIDRNFTEIDKSYTFKENIKNILQISQL